MVGTLALIGGGEFTPECTFDAALAGASRGGRVVLMATAAAYEQPATLERSGRDHLESLGLAVDVLAVYDRRAAADDGAAAVVAAADFVYLTNGSSLHLMSVLKSTPLWAAVVSAWQGGAVLAASGGAARAVLDPMVDPRGGAFTVGLGLLDGASVVPDRGGWSEDRAVRTRELAPSGVALAAVDRSTALIRDPAGSWSVAGAGGASVYVDGDEADLAQLP